MKKNNFPPMPRDPYHRDDEKGLACRLAVANGELSLHPDAANYIGNYNFFGVKNGLPVYAPKVEKDPDNKFQFHYGAITGTFANVTSLQPKQDGLAVEKQSQPLIKLNYKP
jgi:hypothetical protein